MSLIVSEVCQAIWKDLKDEFVSPPKDNEWLEIRHDFAWKESMLSSKHHIMLGVISIITKGRTPLYSWLSVMPSIDLQSPAGQPCTASAWKSSRYHDQSTTCVSGWCSISFARELGSTLSRCQLGWCLQIVQLQTFKSKANNWKHFWHPCCTLEDSWPAYWVHSRINSRCC